MQPPTASPTLTLTATPTSTATTFASETPTSNLPPSETPTVTVSPTITDTPTITLTPTLAPIGYGKVTAFIFPVETPNGKRINHSLRPDRIVILLEKSDASGGPWYRCTWEDNGIPYEGWVLAQYIQVVPGP